MASAYVGIGNCLPDGRWFDSTRHTWRNGRGRPARWRRTRVVLAAAHLDHDPSNNRLRNLKSLCQRCHYPRSSAPSRAAADHLLRRALGDLFLGPSPLHCGLRSPSPTSSTDRPARRPSIPRPTPPGPSGGSRRAHRQCLGRRPGLRLRAGSDSAAVIGHPAVIGTVHRHFEHHVVAGGPGAEPARRQRPVSHRHPHDPCP